MKVLTIIKNLQQFLELKSYQKYLQKYEAWEDQNTIFIQGQKLSAEIR